jgi:hypothetical protein
MEKEKRQAAEGRERKRNGFTVSGVERQAASHIPVGLEQGRLHNATCVMVATSRGDPAARPIGFIQRLFVCYGGRLW